MGAFCDYLSVTYHPEDHPCRRVAVFLAQCGAVLACEGLYRLGDGGTVKVGRMYGSQRVSASGAALAYMRSEGVFMDYLSILSECPHRVTLLDAARDYMQDAPPVIAELQRRYKGQSVNLTRKAVGWKVLLSERPSDGAATGTFYAGHDGSARVSAKVYDKQEEVRIKRGKVIPPTTRYEVRVKKDTGITLRDAAEPERLFWHYASPSLLPRPDGAPEWSPDWSQGWSAGPRPELLPAEVLARRVSNSSELSLLFEIADEMGPNGRQWLVRRFAELAGVEIKGSLSRGSVGAPEASTV